MVFSPSSRSLTNLSSESQISKSTALALLAEFGDQKGNDFADQGEAMIQHCRG